MLVRNSLIAICSLVKSFHRSSCYRTGIANMDTSSKFNLSERLSSLVRPVHYDLLLQPDMDAGVFKGTVKIDVNVKEAKSYLSLHTNFLDITSVKVYKSEEEIEVSKYLEVKQIEQLLIHFEKVLDSGSYKIVIDFNGSLTRNIVGFYLSRLKDDRYCISIITFIVLNLIMLSANTAVFV